MASKVRLRHDRGDHVLPVVCVGSCVWGRVSGVTAELPERCYLRARPDSVTPSEPGSVACSALRCRRMSGTNPTPTQEFKMADSKKGSKKSSAKDLPTKLGAAAAKQVKGGRMRLDPLAKK